MAERLFGMVTALLGIGQKRVANFFLKLFVIGWVFFLIKHTALVHKVLKNGVEVKLQRNALSVLEHPTGNEVDEDYDFDTSSGSDIGEKDHDFCKFNDIAYLMKSRGIFLIIIIDC